MTAKPKEFMTITKEQQEKMLEAAKPLLQWINDNCHPHCQIMLDHNSVELVEGIATQRTNEFLKD